MSERNGQRDSFLNEILDLTHECLLLVDVKTKLIVYANKACESLFGYTEEELIGTPIEVLNVTNGKSIQKEMLKVIKGYPKTHWVEMVQSTKNGYHISVEVISKMGVINGREYILNHITDFNKRKRLQTKMQKLIHQLSIKAYCDYLTGVYNRAYLYETHLECILGRRVGLVMVDIDHFKVINDTYGHPAGDFILVEMTQIILSGIRKKDRVIRYGGDEILVVFSDITAEEVTRIAEQMQNNIGATEFFFGEQPISCSVSIGVSTGLITNKKQFESLVKQVDNNLYQNKIPL